MGGGIRTIKDIEKWISLGINRVKIGTSAIMNEGLVKEAVKIFPKKVSLGLDLIGDFVAIKGWTEVFKEKEFKNDAQRVLHKLAEKHLVWVSPNHLKEYSKGPVFDFVNDLIRDLIMKQSNADQIRERAFEKNGRSLLAYGMNLVKNELTTIEEVERVCLLNETQSEEL